jgi:hypothetical protein
MAPALMAFVSCLGIKWLSLIVLIIPLHPRNGTAKNFLVEQIRSLQILIPSKHKINYIKEGTEHYGHCSV